MKKIIFFIVKQAHPNFNSSRSRNLSERGPDDSQNLQLMQRQSFFGIILTGVSGPDLRPPVSVTV